MSENTDDRKPKAAPTDPLSESDLLSILKDEEADAASYYSSELADAQSNAMDRFFGRPYGDEIEGRSQVVTHDLEDTVNWMMPKLMRAFMQADELISVEDPKGVDDQMTASVADYMKHILFKDNDGETIVHDFAFDALVQRLGVIRAGWQVPKPKPPRIIEGLTVQGLQKYLADPEYEILEAEQEGQGKEPAEVRPGQPPADPNAGVTFGIKVQHTPKMGRVVIENIPPEEFAFSRRARSSKRSDYHRWKREVFMSDILLEFPDSRDELSPDGGSSPNSDTRDVSTDARTDSRFPDEPLSASRGETGPNGRRKCWLIEEDIRVDFDGDGITELRHVKRIGDVILENVEIECSEYHTWTPIRVAHKMVGRSLSDTILDLAKIRTVIMRNTLDSMSQSIVPRTIVNTALADDTTIAALLDADIGGVITVKGNVGDAIQPYVTPDLSAQGLQMIEYMDQRVEMATGVTRHAQGLQPDAITETKGGIEALQGAANERIELIARWLAKGLAEVMETVLSLICQHQDGPRTIKINGKPIQIDPRTWSDEMAVDVSIGMATENRQTRLMNLAFITQKQEAIIAQAGATNPICGVQEYRNTLAMASETMGFKSASKFFKEIPADYQPPEPGPDPKIALEQQSNIQLK